MPADDAELRRRGSAAADVVLTDGTSPWHAAAADGRPDRAVLVDLSPFGRIGPVRRVGDERPRHVGDGRLPVLHRRRPTASRSGCPGRRPSSTPAPTPRSPALVGLHERERSGHGPARRGQPSSRPRSPPTPGSCRRGRPAAHAARAPAERPHPGRGRLGLRDAHRPEGRAVRHDRAARPGRRGPHRRHPDVEREHPADLRGRRRSGRTDKTVAEIVELGQLLRVAVTPVVDGAGVLADEQLAARDWWEREGDIAFPGQPYKFSATPGGAARARRRRIGAARRARTPPAAAERRRVAAERGTTESAAAARGRADPRGHDELGRPGRRPLPRRPRRRQHQGRVGDPPGDAGADLGRARRRTCSARPTTGRCTSTR